MSKNQKLSLDALALKKLAELTVVAVAEAFGDGRTGGCLHARLTDGTPLLDELLVGQPDPAKLSKYIEFATQEKPDRLLEHPTHILSWQSRNPDANQWGGAIILPMGVTHSIVIAFSGFPEMVDEAFCLALAVQMKWVSITAANEIAAISSNQALFHQIENIVKRMAPNGN